jgi:hypothetical protein
MLEVRVPQLLPGTPNFREHWAAKHRRVAKERRDVAICLCAHARPVPPLVVTFVRQGPRTLDDDNAIASMKAARDEVARWLGLKNDSDPRVTWKVEQEKVPRKRAGVVIRLEVRG